MKQTIFKPAYAALLPALLSFSIFSCQKSFDPKSYAPAQTFGGYTSTSQIAPSDLVAYWAFNGSLIDSISKTSATNAGTSFANGIKGQGLQGGVGNYAIFSPTAAIRSLQSMTITYWVNTAQNTAGIQEPICFADSTQFWSNLDMFFDGQTATSSVFKIHTYGSAGANEAWLTNWTINSPWNAWLHIAFTYDEPSTTFTFYVNGTVVGTAIQAGFGPMNFTNFPAIVFGTIQFQTNPSLTSGATSQSWASYLTGSLDEVRIYDKALGSADIKAMYQLEGLGK